MSVYHQIYFIQYQVTTLSFIHLFILSKILEKKKNFEKKNFEKKFLYLYYFQVTLSSKNFLITPRTIANSLTFDSFIHLTYFFFYVEQEELHKFCPNTEYHVIESDEGHDGFLLEQEAISPLVIKFLNKHK